jgi:hypothetical protein
MEQRCLQPYVKVTSANLECKSYVQKNLDGSFSMFSMEEFIHIVMLHPIEVLHEAFSYERYTMGM